MPRQDSSQRMSELQALKVSLEEVRDTVQEVKRAVIVPSRVQSKLPKISKPIRGIDYNRTINPVTWLRSKITDHNGKATDEKYQQFPDDVSDHQIATDAKAIFGRLLEEKLGNQYGMVSWSRACSQRSYRDKCEQVVEDASAMEEFHCFTYSYDYWAIRMLCDAKMKSAMRKSKNRGREQAETGDVQRFLASLEENAVQRSGDNNTDKDSGIPSLEDGEEVREGATRNTLDETTEGADLVLQSGIDIENLPEAHVRNTTNPSRETGSENDDLPISTFLTRTNGTNANRTQPATNRGRTAATTIVRLPTTRLAANQTRPQTLSHPARRLPTPPTPRTKRRRTSNRRSAR